MNTLNINILKNMTSCVAAVFVLGACSSDVNYDFASSEQNSKTLVPLKSTFDPANGLIPQPNNLLFAGSVDGTLNIPLGDVSATDFSNPIVALNALDGFSTTEAITSSFAQVEGQANTQGLDPASIAIGSSVRVFEVSTNEAGAVTGSVAELGATELFATASPDGNTLAVLPLKPLKESTTYMVVITNAVTDTNGTPVGRAPAFTLATESKSLIDTAAAALEPIRLGTRAMLDVAQTSHQIEPATVVQVWNFLTQSTTPVLLAAKAAAVSTSINLALTGATTSATGGNGSANIWSGLIDVPYYLDVPTAENPTASLNTWWEGAGDSNLTRFNPTPVRKSTQSIPVLMTTPVADPPVGGWPIVIFQHGITTNRSVMLAVADAFAAAGIAVIGIDMPLHGIATTDATAAFRIAGKERTFDLDLANNTTGEPKPDGVTDASGAYFVNLRNVLNVRGNLRQAIADLFTLSASVGTIPNINPDLKGFVGHSLGAMAGSTFLAFDNSVDSASLVYPGGGTSRLFAASPSFGPSVTAGLAAAGIDVNGPEGQAFLLAKQTVVDSADPINHTAATVANTNMHLVQSLTDQTIVASVAGAPLVGTEPMGNLMGLPKVTSTTQGSGWVQFLEAGHGSLLTPGENNVDLAVTAELHKQIATYAASGGVDIVISNPALIQGGQ